MTYVIRATAHYYGPSDKHFVISDYNGTLEFPTLAEAKAHIALLDSERYVTMHNECTRPTYKAVRKDRLPKFLAAEYA